MSPRKLTENDKQEILEQYRTSQATTSTLAKSYEVSSSTISRFLKNKLSSTEYEDLIQQKRLARTPRGEKSAKKAKDSTKKTKTTQNRKSSKAKSKPEEVQTVDIDVAIDETTVVSTPESIPDAIATPADPRRLLRMRLPPMQSLIRPTFQKKNSPLKRLPSMIPRLRKRLPLNPKQNQSQLLFHAVVVVVRLLHPSLHQILLE